MANLFKFVRIVHRCSLQFPVDCIWCQTGKLVNISFIQDIIVVVKPPNWLVRIQLNRLLVAFYFYRFPQINVILHFYRDINRGH